MSACPHKNSYGHCVECCDDVHSAAYRLIGTQKERITELEQTLDRLEDATEIRPPDLSELQPEDRAPAYTTWLEGKVKQLQAREQLVHELGRGYAEVKLKNRELEEALTLAKRFMRHWAWCSNVLSSMCPCDCGHTEAMEKTVLALPRPTVVIECGDPLTWTKEKP